MNESAEQMEQRYVAVMGAAVGKHFHDMTQQNAFFHMKWNAYVALFGKSPKQIEAMNKAAPGFFWLVQEAWWDDRRPMTPGICFWHGRSMTRTSSSFARSA